MTKITKYPVPEAIAENALINHQQYLDEYQRSVEDPDSYWREKGQIVDWIKPYTRVKNTSLIRAMSVLSGLRTAH